MGAELQGYTDKFPIFSYLPLREDNLCIVEEKLWKIDTDIFISASARFITLRQYIIKYSGYVGL